MKARRNGFASGVAVPRSGGSADYPGARRGDRVGASRARQEGPQRNGRRAEHVDVTSICAAPAEAHERCDEQPDARVGELHRSGWCSATGVVLQPAAWRHYESDGMDRKSCRQCRRVPLDLERADRGGERLRGRGREHHGRRAVTRSGRCRQSSPTTSAAPGTTSRPARRRTAARSVASRSTRSGRSTQRPGDPVPQILLNTNQVVQVTARDICGAAYTNYGTSVGRAKSSTRSPSCPARLVGAETSRSAGPAGSAPRRQPEGGRDRRHALITDR